ncbi:hypothetical protein L6R53_11145 [Myxococcota bacterium]|nr:hypothetical protein [Myxococcota bacterium]
MSPPQRAALGPWLRAAPALAAMLLPLLVPGSLSLYDTEGSVEHVTVVLLAALCVRGAWRRDPWLVLGAALLVLEEVDWLQHQLGYATPGWLKARSPRSSQANLHNIPGSDLLWRWLPVALVLLRARPTVDSRLQALGDRLGLPTFHADAAWTGLALAALTPPLILLRGERVWDEALELALVLWVTATLRGRVDPDPTR